MASFTEALTGLRQELNQSRHNRLRTLASIRSQVQAQAETTAQQLAEQARHRGLEFASMMDDLRGTVRESARRTRGRLANLNADLRRGGAAFRRG